MEGSSRNVEASSQLLDVMENGRDWHLKMDHKRKLGESSSLEDKKLELRLAPPGTEDWSFKEKYGEQAQNFGSSAIPHGTSALMHQGNVQHSSSSTSFLQFSSTPQKLPVMAKESSQPCNTKVVEKKAFSIVVAPANTAVVPSGRSQKRIAPGPVVGWPPIRSSRKNLACNSSSKHATEPQCGNSTKTACEKQNSGKGLYIKINMDGIPIGRKVDLQAYDSYDKLSSAVDELFRGLLAAQRDYSADGNHKQHNDNKSIAGLGGGNGEYTLVYEDNEGDRMLVGDVPWHMFVSAVKRLRVLKSSEVSALNLGSTRQDDMPSA